MSSEKTPDWLPAGWTVHQRVRKSGKKDMFYTDPSNELKFYSKPEVLRHLKKKQEISYQKSNEKKSTSKLDENVLAEKIGAEELPPGWIKELRVKKIGHKIRKDSNYTDPVTGYIFHSLKDVNRYLKTGVVGKLASKPKDDRRVAMELNDEKLTTDSAAGEKSADEGSNGHVTGYPSSKVAETGNDELTPAPTNTANSICISENVSEPCRENVAVGNVDIPEPSGLDSREENAENELKEKQAIQDKKRKSGEKSKPGFPRRASKRLAGVDIGLPPEPKTRRQAAARRADEVITSNGQPASSFEIETKVTTDESSNEEQVNSAILPNAKILPEEMDNKPKEMQDGNAVANKKANEKQQVPIVLTPGSHATPNEHWENVRTDRTACVNGEELEVKSSNMSCALPPPIFPPKECNGEVETNNMPMEVQEPSCQFPAANITASEERGGSEVVKNNILDEKLELPNKVEGGNNDNSCSKHEVSNASSLVDLFIPEENPGSVVTDNNATIKPDLPESLSLTDLWTDPCIEFAVKTLTGAIPVGEGNGVDTYSGAPLDLPLGGLWTDPCIEFAVKTLTGAIPVGEDLNVQEYFQQHACSSVNQSENSLTLPDVGISNFSPTEFVSQHFNSAENSLHKQQEFVVPPTLPNHRTGSLQFPNGAGINQGNNGERSRQTFF